jgi:hypothetical protein
MNAIDIDMQLVQLALTGYKLHTKRSIAKGAVYTWFEPTSGYDKAMYEATYSDSLRYVTNVIKSINGLTKFLEQQEEQQ